MHTRLRRLFFQHQHVIIFKYYGENNTCLWENNWHQSNIIHVHANFLSPRSLILRLLLLFSFIFSSSGFRYCSNVVEFLFKNFQCRAAETAHQANTYTYIVYQPQCIKPLAFAKYSEYITRSWEMFMCKTHIHTHENGKEWMFIVRSTSNL